MFPSFKSIAIAMLSIIFVLMVFAEYFSTGGIYSTVLIFSILIVTFYVIKGFLYLINILFKTSKKGEKDV